MPPPASAARLGVIGVVLVVLGIACAGGYRVASANEHAAFAAAGVPPPSAAVTAGESYLLAVPGGVSALQRAHLDPGHLQCQWSTPGGGAQMLAVTPLGAQTKATDAIASFTGPYTGPISVDCLGWGAAFVADADDVPTDYAGILLLLASVCLTLGAPFALAGLRGRPRSGRRTCDDDEVQRLVHVVRARVEDEEVAGGDGRDVGT